MPRQRAFGIRGHVYILAPLPARVRFSFTGRTTPHTRTSIFTEAFDAVITDGETPNGKAWKVVDIPAPRWTRDQDGWTSYSCVNRLVTNGAVIACFRYGRGIRYITQQQPVGGSGRERQCGRGVGRGPAVRSGVR